MRQRVFFTLHHAPFDFLWLRKGMSGKTITRKKEMITKSQPQMLMSPGLPSRSFGSFRETSYPAGFLLETECRVICSSNLVFFLFNCGHFFFACLGVCIWISHIFHLLLISSFGFYQQNDETNITISMHEYSVKRNYLVKNSQNQIMATYFYKLISR